MKINRNDFANAEALATEINNLVASGKETISISVTDTASVTIEPFFDCASRDKTSPDWYFVHCEFPHWDDDNLGTITKRIFDYENEVAKRETRIAKLFAVPESDRDQCWSDRYKDLFGRRPH